MKLTVPFVALLLVGCAQSPAPAPVAAIEAIPPPPPGYVIETAPPPPPGYEIEAPSRDEFIADPEAVVAFNRNEEAKEAARRAEWAADSCTDRIVEAQEDTRRAVEAVADKL